MGQRDGTMGKTWLGVDFDTIVIKNVGLVRGLTKGREIQCIWTHKISTMTSIYVQMARTA